MILNVYLNCQSIFSESVEGNVPEDDREDSMDLECEGNVAGCAAVAPPDDRGEDSMDLELVDFTVDI